MTDLTPGQRFYEGIRDHQGGECWLEARGGCDGRLQAHHIYPKRLLIALHRRATLDVKLGKAGPIPVFDLDAALGDWRNGVLLFVRPKAYNGGMVAAYTSELRPFDEALGHGGNLALASRQGGASCSLLERRPAGAR